MCRNITCTFSIRQWQSSTDAAPTSLLRPFSSAFGNITFFEPLEIRFLCFHHANELVNAMRPTSFTRSWSRHYQVVCNDVRDHYARINQWALVRNFISFKSVTLGSSVLKVSGVRSGRNECLHPECVRQGCSTQRTRIWFYRPHIPSLCTNLADRGAPLYSKNEFNSITYDLLAVSPKMVNASFTICFPSVTHYL